jgi:hypothetical protein
VNISSFGQKTIAGGFGTYPIHTEFQNISRNTIFTNVRNITIVTPFSNAWFVFINRSLMKANIINPQNYLKDTGKAVVLNLQTFTSVIVNLKIIDIRAQIGPGWAE